MFSSDSVLKVCMCSVCRCNGSLPGGDRGRRRSRFSLFERPSANGVKPSTTHTCSPQAAKVISKNSQHSVSYTLSWSEAVVVEYTDDNETDMFQIGRSTENPIDIVVTETAGGRHGNSPMRPLQSTVSRFACRIVCDRTPPYTARVYAAGFDCSRNIFLGEKAAKWRTFDGQMDGLTTNGVLLMQPARGSKPAVWREISVCGNVFTLRDTTSPQDRGKQVKDESPVLLDGSLIDLCGVTLLWRSVEGLSRSPTAGHLEALRLRLNAARPQCPVLLSTLAFPSLDGPRPRRPWVYLTCGHVHGYHPWQGREEERGERECPLCRSRGPYVPLTLGRVSDVYVDAESPSHAFVPCGHVCSERTAEHWSKTPLKRGTNIFHPACPFCLGQLKRDRPYVRLIFQGPLD
uniref:Pellino E3 ubiquitin protein ligase 1a n=1 Tax=Pygocentrus nattereri TaxID=42514 RepID=A0A3B4C6L7_PYGNA